MGPLLNDWILARMMSAPKADDGIIYQLYDHYCDGTGATCVDTGIRMLSEQFITEHPLFEIEISYTPGLNANKAHVIRCCNPKFPYNGFKYRKERAGEYEVSYGRNGIMSLVVVRVYQDRRNTVFIKFDFNSLIFTAYDIDRQIIGSGTLVYCSECENCPFTIGGSVINGVDASGGWKETWKGTINSLIIRDIR